SSVKVAAEDDAQNERAADSHGQDQDSQPHDSNGDDDVAEPPLRNERRDETVEPLADPNQRPDDGQSDESVEQHGKPPVAPQGGMPSHVTKAVHGQHQAVPE